MVEDIDMKLTPATLVALVAVLGGCMTGPRRISNPPKDYLEVNSPSRVWATLDDGSRLIIDGPRVISDTVFGWAEGEEVAIPTDQLEEIRVRQLSVFRSALLPTALVGGSVGMFVLIKNDPTVAPPEDSTQLGGIEAVRLPRP